MFIAQLVILSQCCRVTLVMEDLQCMFMVTPPLDVWRRDAVRIGMASCRLGRFSNAISWDSIGRYIGRGSSSLLRCCKNHCSVLSLVPRLSSRQAEEKAWYQPNNESAPIPNARCTVTTKWHSINDHIALSCTIDKRYLCLYSIKNGRAW